MAIPIKDPDASNKPRPRFSRPSGGFGQALDDFVAPLRVGVGEGPPMDSGEFWRLEAERLEDDNDAHGAFEARLKWWGTRMRETEQ